MKNETINRLELQQTLLFLIASFDFDSQNRTVIKSKLKIDRE